MPRRFALLLLLVLSLAFLSSCGEEASPGPRPTTTATAPPPTLVPPTPTVIPTATTVSPTATPLPPTVTPVPPTATTVPATATPERVTGWRVFTGSDLMTDRKSVGIAHTASTYEPSRREGPPILVVRCTYGGKTPQELEVYIDWRTFVSTERVPVTWRWDDTKALNVRWAVGVAHESTFAPTMGRNLASSAFLRFMLEHDQLAVRVTPYNRTPVTAVWDLTSLGEALSPLQEHCP